jgi:hypothetical protein
MKEIIMTKGYVSLVDDADFGIVNKYKWHVYRRNHIVYAISTIREKGKRKTIYLHQVIMGTMNKGREIQIDHIDGNGLNNIRENLRRCTGFQNQHNRRRCRKSTSKYKGVNWNIGTKKWISRICCNRKRIHLGYFKNELDAAIAYNAAAIKYFGEFARLNIISDPACPEALRGAARFAWMKEAGGPGR